MACGARRSPSFRSILVATIALVTAGLGALSAQKGKGGPEYTMHLLASPPGAGSVTAVAINRWHEIAGIADPFMGQERALYWSSLTAAPVVLPCPVEPCRSWAAAINDDGVIAGTADAQAVLWRPSGSGWIVQLLPRPGDDTWQGNARSLLDDGTAGGHYGPASYGTATFVPVIWHSAGAITQLPVPSQFFSSEVNAVNPSGDAVGNFKDRIAAGWFDVYGSIWVNDATGYVPLTLTFLVSGLTPRAPDGSFLVSSTEGRLRVQRSGGAWSVAVEATGGGPGTGINAAGDMTGFQARKGSSIRGVPYLLTFDNRLIKLPIPNTAVGQAAGASLDRWVVGDIVWSSDRPAVVWKPN